MNYPEGNGVYFQDFTNVFYILGYVIHESAGWSDLHQRWMFLPRRASTEQYHDTTDEKMGTNVLILADESFDKIEVSF